MKGMWDSTWPMPLLKYFGWMIVRDAPPVADMTQPFVGLKSSVRACHLGFERPKRANPLPQYDATSDLPLRFAAMNHTSRAPAPRTASMNGVCRGSGDHAHQGSSRKRFIASARKAA